MAKILILGGTTEGYGLAQKLHEMGEHHVISSLAGRTLRPRLPVGEVRIGGFGGMEGLKSYLTDHTVQVVIDATHPFASRMGWHAHQACTETNTALLRFERPAWTPTPDDHWISVTSWDEAIHNLASHPHRVLMTIGRQDLAAFTRLARCWFLIRSVDPPDPLPDFAQAEILLARGPFKVEDEIALMQSQKIDCLVTKNSGGDATQAKLIAARALGIKVIMHERPRRPTGSAASTDNQVIRWIDNLTKKQFLDHA